MDDEGGEALVRELLLVEFDNCFFLLDDEDDAVFVLVVETTLDDDVWLELLRFREAVFSFFGFSVAIIIEY